MVVGQYDFLQQVLEKFEIGSAEIQSPRRLDQGLSGAQVYRFEISQEVMVLKYTPRDAENLIRQRAEREEKFYAQLAPTLSLGVPRVLGSFSDDQLGSAILFQAYQGIEGWSQELLTGSVRAIAKLHAAFWDQAKVLEKYSWLTVKPDQISDQRKVEALQTWQEIFDRLEQPEKGQWVAKWIGQVDAICEYVQAFPRTVVHGDYHPGNYLLNDRGELLLCDWQEIGYGNPLEDLSFFIQRGGGKEGVDLVREYVGMMRDEQGIGLDLARVRKGVLGYELISKLLDWPDYLGQAGAEFIEEFLQRVQEGMEEL